MIKVVGWRVNFPSDAIADSEGLLGSSARKTVQWTVFSENGSADPRRTGRQTPVERVCRPPSNGSADLRRTGRQTPEVNREICKPQMAKKGTASAAKQVPLGMCLRIVRKFLNDGLSVLAPLHTDPLIILIAEGYASRSVLFPQSVHKRLQLFLPFTLRVSHVE